MTDPERSSFLLKKTPKGGHSLNWTFRDWIGAAICALVLCFIAVIAVSLLEGNSPSTALSAIKDFVIELVRGSGNSN
ncbi:MAG: hypothetical protein ACLQJR_02210 [Stellaceae bacterium]